ncbi:hypothetical protein GIB67_022007 [Kingdonia uniflora]|uniref:Terpene cyclase/mutase family member n=1 Tax=Kingdonia uniflora TaxID=39325 RepID=A0A7J7L5M4_9MAGN|nr:hypothetical protein GIB67_022007 [Kingdonia uniflora]
MWKLKIADRGGPYSQWLYSTNDFVGRQTWEFDPDAGTPEEKAQVDKVREEFYQNRFQVKPSGDVLLRLQMLKENKDKYDLTIPPVKIGDDEEVTSENATMALRRAVRFFSSMLTCDGHWASDIGGPLFFMPPMVFTLYITGMLDTMFSPEHKKETLRYMYCHQNEDGGWGFHIEGHSTMFGTTLNYICMRLLGEGPEGGEDNACARAQKWIRDHGGVTSIPSWGKTWLSILGLSEWSGCNPMPPEFWLLPSFMPMHPAKMWCYCRMVYMPMSYLYGKRFVGPLTDVILSLRKELHIEPYNEIQWFKYRHVCAKVLCMLACWVEDPKSDAFKKHLARVPDYLWMAEDGMRVQSFGSQMWDTGFGVQALLASNLHEEITHTLKKGHDFIKQSQVKDNPSGDFKSMHRHISKGAWTFSDQDHGWQVSDCTAEGLMGCLLFSQLPSEMVGEKMETDQMFDSVNLLLSLQSENGGLSAWEPATAHEWLEVLNPTEFFQDIVIEHEYVECTASTIQALVVFMKLYPGHRKNEIETFITKAVRYLEDQQMLDGSWYGNWGICFIYGTWFALRGLAAAGKNCNNSLTVRKLPSFYFLHN